MVKPVYLRWEKLLLMLWFVINLSIGILTVHGYGMSVDETNNHRYAGETLEAYPSLFGTLYQPKYDSSYDGHGPAFLAMAGLVVRNIQSIFPNILDLDLWHLAYFITFQLTGLCLYGLIRRWSSAWTAWGTLILFTSQPLLWGHAFINPKDIPFTFFFTLSITLGFRMIDRLNAGTSNSLETQLEWLRHNFWQGNLLRGLTAFISQMWKQARQWGPTVGGNSLRSWFADFVTALRQPSVIFAGLALGLATAIRPIAPFAGVIVLLFLFLKDRSKVWIAALAYFLIAGITAYVAWPHLWGAPIQRYLASLKTASSFPERGTLLFMGGIYYTDQLPRKFFPTVLALQMTEPALILILLGTAVALYLFRKGKKLEPILLVFLWFVVPTSLVILLQPTLYDNARHLLFLWPALFILAAVGLEPVITWIKPSLAKIALITILAAPGIYSIAQLYPYEYVYYNSLVGGVRGAYRNFELDYWDTSFREAMAYLNKNAEPGSRVMVLGSSTQAARQFVRAHLVVTGLQRVTKADTQPYYLLASTRRNGDLDHCRKAEVVAAVERDGAVLSVIRKINAGQNCK